MTNNRSTSFIEEKNREESHSLHSFWTNLFLLMLLMAGVISSWIFINWLYKADNFPFKQVELTNKLVNQERKELQSIAVGAINGGFFSLDVDEFRRKLLAQLPWVESVAVRKVWPDKLLVSITEHQPVGRWSSIENKDSNSNKNSMSLLSRNGIVFYPQLTEKQIHKFNQMALLTGPGLSAKKVLENCFKINEQLKLLKSRVQQCGMNQRRSWLITLNNGINIKLGKENIMQNLTQYTQLFSRQLKPYFDQVEYADLRFTNGFSIKWKKVDESVN